LKAAIDWLVTKEVQQDLELLQHLHSVPLTPRQQFELLAIFGSQRDLIPDIDVDVLYDVVNPHYIAYALFADRISAFTARNQIDYSTKFVDGSDTTWANWATEQESESKFSKILDYFLKSPSFPQGFNSGQEELFHMKFCRLMEDYYDIDLDTIEGLATVDDLVHTFDVSPGEETLERCHAFPIPEHTYDELPIIKYDGYDDCIMPPHTEEQDFDDETVENLVDWYCEDLGEEDAPLDPKNKETNKISDYKASLLHSYFHGCEEDELRLHKRALSFVLPNSEVDLLFFNKFDKYNESHH